MQLYDYQKYYAKLVADKIREKHLCLLYADTRTGKTPISLTVAQLLKKKNVLFITKKKAIVGIQKFLHLYTYGCIKVVNFESLHKVNEVFDFIIIDESHSLSAFPKPSKRAKRVKELASNGCDILLLTATPMNESPSQMYHQLYVSKHSPFSAYTNFYKFAKVYVHVTAKFISGRTIKDYSKIKESFIDDFNDRIDSVTIRLTKDTAGEFGGLDESIHYVKGKQAISRLMTKLKQNRYIRLTYKKSEYEIIADTPVKLASAFHQLSSGGIKCDDNYLVLDDSKCQYIKDKYKGKKIAIFYLFIHEYKQIVQVFGASNITDNLDEFSRSKDKIYVSQFLAGSMGTDLSSADYIIMLNVPFSATVYAQVMERGRLRGKTEMSNIHWIFSDYGIEQSVYETVNNKINYSSKLFLQFIGSSYE